MAHPLRVWIRGGFRQVLKIFYLFPVKSNRIFFANFCTSQYACNPKYLTEYLCKKYPDRFDIIWTEGVPEETCRTRGIRVAAKNSLRYYYYVLTSKVFVSNAGMPTYLPFRKKQITVATWHGGGLYKMAGVDTPAITGRDRQEFAQAAAATRLYLSSSRLFTERVIRQAFLYSGEVLDSGLPRNDLFFEPKEKQAAIARRVKERYGIGRDTKVILFAPTFRGRFEHARGENHEGLNVEACLQAAEERFGGKWAFFYRMHHALAGNGEGIGINVSDYPDMQEILCAADILITDYSSSMWDFALTGKPGFLFATDVESYESERDFYMPIEEWPYPVATSGEKLTEEIRRFDEQRHLAKVTRHLENLGSYEKGEACQMAGERIAAECLGKREIAE